MSKEETIENPEPECKHQWEVVCVCCETEDGDSVVECVHCGEEGYIPQAKRII